ncbi:MAG TPA: glycosyltransferase, partial [Parafilimonas sp.]|nr:glycosyltransferase [Parafilimonas sp.]
CMDELSAFKFAPPELLHHEKKLLQKADIVFTGGYSIYYSKQNLHNNIYPFPSSIDKAHFAKARNYKDEPEDQEQIPHPRFGFFGVLDERFDIDLVASVAAQKPGWHFILLGPVVKIDPGILPKLNNIHYIGSKQYNELPQYLAGWDIAIIPFAINESTKYISPTKTPEYLAGGKPVISTPIRDVVSPYGDNGLVQIVSDTNTFIHAAQIELDKKDRKPWLNQVDAFLADNSWDNTWEQMLILIDETWKQINNKTTLKVKTYV